MDLEEDTFEPYSACSWTPWRQEHCRYYSNIKIFCEAGVWSIGSRMILKERSSNPPNFDAVNIRFLKKNTTIPIPEIVEDWSANGRYFCLMKRVPGECLEKVWGKLSAEKKDSIAKQTAEYLSQLRKLQSPKMQTLGGQPLYSTFLFHGEHGEPHGSLSSDDELWENMEGELEGIPGHVRRRLRARMPSAAPYTFTHNDIAIVNIMVENGRLMGIIDWESSGYFPVWWEYTAATIGLSQEDRVERFVAEVYASSSLFGLLSLVQGC